MQYVLRHTLCKILNFASRLIWHQMGFRLEKNQSEKCNNNSNLLWLNKTQRSIFVYTGMLTNLSVLLFQSFKVVEAFFTRVLIWAEKVSNACFHVKMTDFLVKFAKETWLLVVERGCEFCFFFTLLTFFLFIVFINFFGCFPNHFGKYTIQIRAIRLKSVYNFKLNKINQECSPNLIRETVLVMQFVNESPYDFQVFLMLNF